MISSYDRSKNIVRADVKSFDESRVENYVIVQLYKQYRSSGAACPERIVVSAVEPSRRKLRAKAYLREAR